MANGEFQHYKGYKIVHVVVKGADYWQVVKDGIALHVNAWEHGARFWVDKRINSRFIPRVIQGGRQ